MTTISLDAMETVMGGCGQQQQPQQQPQQPAGGDASAGGNQPTAGAESASPSSSSPAAGGCNWMSLLQSFMSFLQSNSGGAAPAAGQQPQG